VYVPYQKAPRAVNAYRAINARTAVGALVWSLITSSSIASQIWSIRDQLKILQGWDNQDLPLLLADYYTARAQLIASLFGLTDEQLDITPPDNGWTVRQTLEHVLYWDRNSIDTLAAEFQPATGASD